MWTKSRYILKFLTSGVILHHIALQGRATFCLPDSNQCTEMCFASFLSNEFITAIVVNPPERRLAKRTSVHCQVPFHFLPQFVKALEWLCYTVFHKCGHTS